MGKKHQDEDDVSEYETDSGSSDYEEESDSEEEEEAKPVKKAAAPAAKAAAKPAAKAKEAEPCKKYRVDTTADKFGTCKCGWSKVDHETKGKNKAKEALERLKSDKSAVAKQDAPCMHFRVDTTAEKFGMCKCGWHQSDHKAKGENKAREALKSLKQRAQPVNVTKGDKPCDNYRIDPTAEKFGMCHCGFSKLDHEQKKEDPAAAMLRKLKEKNQSVHEREDRLAAGLTDAPSSKKSGSSPASPASGATGRPAAKGCCIVM